MKVDIGAFDLAVRVGAQVEWLEETDDHAILNLRKQFTDNLDMLAREYQRFFAKSLAVAVKKNGMYFTLPDLDMKGMTDDQLEDLKDLG